MTADSKLDYKKQYKDIYMPGKQPAIVQIPKMNYVAVQGKGNPNDEDGEYKKSIGMLYAISFTIKMSYKTQNKIDGYFEYVVPPLEGLWWMENGQPGVDYSNKDGFCFISMIRLPEFVTREVFDWARSEAREKKNMDLSKAEFFELDEGLCVQCMHVGSYDDEPATILKMHEYIKQNGYENDFSSTKRHHEIYLSDPRRTSTEKLKTVIRHPVKKIKV